ncbi:MAG: TonB family protein [Bacteroidales bacterium]|nr:TonB family protein [Bacteroidales bacterium]
MEAKKSPRADLEKKKGLYLEIGLIFSLAIVLLAFSIKSYDQSKIEPNNYDGPIMDVLDDILNTDQQEEVAPPPEQEQQTTEFEIVDDNVEIENEVVPVNADDNANSAQQDYVAPVVEDIEDEKKEVEIFVVVESMPEYPGGETELYKYLGNSINYPEQARNLGLQGKVYVTFVVEKDGSIANPKVLRDIGGGCGEEALRVVRSMPKWKPGKQHGKNVRVQYNLPVLFQLE